MSTELATNADYIQPAVDAAKEHARALLAYARAHPDEVAVGLLPFAAILLATGRHRLNVIERFLLTEAAYWGGLALAGQYKAWKARPAVRPGPRLRKVT